MKRNDDMFLKAMLSHNSNLWSILNPHLITSIIFFFVKGNHIQPECFSISIFILEYGFNLCDLISNKLFIWILKYKETLYLLFEHLNRYLSRLSCDDFSRKLFSLTLWNWLRYFYAINCRKFNSTNDFYFWSMIIQFHKKYFFFVFVHFVILTELVGVTNCFR